MFLIFPAPDLLSPPLDCLINGFFREVHEEANQAREKASELKLRRQEQAAAHREKLKKAYLQKRLEKLKAAQKAEDT